MAEFGSLGSLFFTVLLASAVLVTFTGFYGNVLSEYGMSATNASNEVGAMNTFNEINSTTYSISNNLRQSNANENPFILLLTGAIPSLLQSFSLLGVLVTFLDSSSIYLASMGISIGFWSVVFGSALFFFITWMILQTSLSKQV